MKKNKLAALLLSSVMVVSVVASCDQPITNPSVSSGPSSVTEPTDPATPGATEVSPDLDGYKELTVPKTVSDASDGKITIYSHNSAFIGLAEKYAGITPDSYSLVEVANNKGAYTDKLDAVLSDGNNAPDIFTCDEAYARKYLASDNTIAINDLGIDYSECKNMKFSVSFYDKDHPEIWYGGFSDYLDQCGDLMQRSADGKPFDVGDNPLVGTVGFLISLGLAAIIAILISNSLRRGMRSAKEQTQANSYIVPNGVVITRRIDQFTHTTETRVYDPPESKSSGGGGGGGTHISGGGSSHSSGKF